MRVWRPVGRAGVEYLTVDNSGEMLSARGSIIGLDRSSPFRLMYDVSHDVAVGVREAAIELADGNGNLVRTLHLDGGDLGDCTDIDIPETPFTNSLAIRSLDLRVGESREISVAQLNIPELHVETVLHRYTRLDDLDGEQVYRFDASDGDAVVDLTVDSEGLVRDYPGRFKRILL